MTSGAVSRTSKAASALGALLLVASTLAIVVPTTSAISATGVWIFPTAVRADAVDGNLKDRFYNTTSNDAWIADAFFADASPDNISVSVDFYNPTSTAFESVQVFVAVNNFDLFESISFSGGPAGVETVTADDLGAGTPLLPDNTAMSSHNVYPAYFASYGVGDLDMDGDVSTIYVNATGDFEGGLVLRLDWTGSDANGAAYEGPFDAGMSIYDWGDLPAEDCIEDGGLVLHGTVDGKYDPDAGVDVDATLDLASPFEYSRDPVVAQFVVEVKPGSYTFDDLFTFEMSDSFTFGDLEVNGKAQEGEKGGPLNLSGGLNGSYVPVNISFDADLQLLPPFAGAVTLSAQWDDCNGGGSASATITYHAQREVSGETQSAKGWDEEIKNADKDKRKALYNDSQFDTLFQIVAYNSPVFTYSPWKGTDPAGGSDEGYLDIGSLSAAHDVMKGRGHAPERVEKAQRQLLALWLNIAVGALNPDSELVVVDDCKANQKNCETTFVRKTGLSELGPLEVVAILIGNAETQLLDWKAGNGYSKAEIVLATQLCKAVNRGWAVLA